MKFHRHVLEIDAARESERIAGWMVQHVRRTFRKNGVVVAVSGGVDSAVVLALCVNAFGTAAVLPLLLPEKESSPDSEQLARHLCRRLGVEPHVENITDALEGFGCYARRDEAVRRIHPSYDPARGARMKIGLPQNLIESDTLNVFSVTIIDPDGTEHNRPLPMREFLEITAASNFKQRARMAMAYYYAEQRNYAVMGTANRNEQAQGFFVKHGDGGADLQPIAHLFKTQVYQLARHLGIPDEIVERTPTTDTYSAPCTQQEFFFRIPFALMDLVWYGLEHGVRVCEIASVVGLDVAQVERVRNDLQRKQRGTDYLRAAALKLENEPCEKGAEQTVF